MIHGMDYNRRGNADIEMYQRYLSLPAHAVIEIVSLVKFLITMGVACTLPNSDYWTGLLDSTAC